MKTLLLLSLLGQIDVYSGGVYQGRARQSVDCVMGATCAVTGTSDAKRVTISVADAGASGGAPIGAKYIAAEASADLSAEVVPSASDQIPVSDSTSATTWRTIPDCADTGGNHLNYTAGNNTFQCGTTGSGSGAPTDATYITQTASASLSNEQAMGALGTGIVLNATTTGVQSIYAGSACGANTVARSTNASGALTCSAVTSADISGAVATATALAANGSNCAGNEFALGVNASGVSECAQPAFSNLSGAATDSQVPDSITISLAAMATALAANPAACGANTFVTDTAANGDLACAQPAFSNLSGAATIAQGGTTETASTEDAVLVGASTTDWQPKVLPSCSNATTSKLLYDTTTNTFSCGTDQTGGGGAVTLTSSGTQSDAVIAGYTAITGLSFTPAANTNYLIDCFIIYTSTAATTGINFAWDVPAAVTSIHMTGYTTTTAVGAIQGFIQRADNVGTPTSAAIVTTEQVAVLQARLKNGGNATSTSLGFTPETANSVSVIAGSTCQYTTF